MSFSCEERAELIAAFTKTVENGRALLRCARRPARVLSWRSLAHPWTLAGICLEHRIVALARGFPTSLASSRRPATSSDHGNTRRSGWNT